MQHQYLTVPLEIKALSARQIEGHGAVFGNVDLGGDIVLAGAFKASLIRHRKNGTVPQMFWMHDPSRVPGAWEEVREDNKGLYVKGTLADTELGNEMRTLAGMNAVRGLSIGYRPTDIDYDSDGNRLLKQVDVGEVSLVSLAMNPLAQIESVKARLSASGEYVPTAREFERILRDVGCSKNIARTLVAKVIDDEPGGMLASHLRDAGDDDEEALAAWEAVRDRMLVALVRS